MYRFLLTPRWWGINVFALVAIPVCVFMGSWQLSRFEDRVHDDHKSSSAAATAREEPARPLDKLLPVSEETSGERARVSGHYADQFLVPGRDLDGRDGSYVLTLLRTDGGDALPVVRGWLPGHPTRASAAPGGEVTLTGRVQASETPGSDGVTAAGGLPAGQVGLINAASLVNLVHYGVYDAWLTLDRASPGMTAVPAKAPEGSGLDLKAFQNLGYTGEWFVFAGFVVFMWFRLMRREAEAERDARLGLLPREPGPEGSAGPEGSRGGGGSPGSEPGKGSGGSGGSGRSDGSGGSTGSGGSGDSGDSGDEVGAVSAVGTVREAGAVGTKEAAEAAASSAGEAARG